MILGHETCGQVAQLGNQVKDLKVGDIVAIGKLNWIFWRSLI